MSAWLYQDDKQVKKHGTEAASWYVGWHDPAGKRRCKSCGPGFRGKKTAEKLCEKISAELLTGTYQDASRKTWAEFRVEYDRNVLADMSHGTRTLTREALKHFERIAKPAKMAAITSKTIAEFITVRRKARNKAGTGTISPASVNKELRHLRSVFRKAHRWGWLPKVPDIDFLKEVKRIPCYIPADHFGKLYEACDGAALPSGLSNATAADWWRALLIMAYMTGWRISELLDLKWVDVDLDAGTAITRGDTNKGRRDELVPLHPAIVDHLRLLVGFNSHVFPWTHGQKAMYTEFWKLQKRAGVRPDDKRRYGFHDLRRAFATMNADRLTADALQTLMRHKSYETTKKYVNMARQLNPAVANLYVPDVPAARKTATSAK